MTITATEFKTHFGKYLELAKTEVIYIQKNNKIVAKLSEPWPDRRAVLDSLVGIASNLKDSSLEDIKDERLARQ